MLHSWFYSPGLALEGSQGMLVVDVSCLRSVSALLPRVDLVNREPQGNPKLLSWSLLQEMEAERSPVPCSRPPRWEVVGLGRLLPASPRSRGCVASV